MRLETRIVAKYLFSKKRNGFINIISWITIAAMAIGSAVLIILMSTFNGFTDLLINDINRRFNPEIRISPTDSKIIEFPDEKLDLLRGIDGVKAVFPVLEETLLLENKNVRIFAKAKGVPAGYFKDDRLEKLNIQGLQGFREEDMVLGKHLVFNLGIDPDSPWNVIKAVFANRDYKPLPGMRPLHYGAFRISGVFSLGFSNYDSELAFLHLDKMSKLLKRSEEYSSIEVFLYAGASKKDIKKEILRLIGDEKIKIQNRYEQEESTYKLFQLEKTVGYLIVCLILILVLFNLMACLWMIVLEKKRDFSILRAMGMPNSRISKLVYMLGTAYSLLGMVVGLIVGIALVMLQQYIGLYKIGTGMTIQYYPVKLQIPDVFLIIATIFGLSLLVSIPAARLAKSMAMELRER